MTSVFSANEYRKFLKEWLKSGPRGRGILSKLALAMSCQNSHLSRVLREEVHLTLDQAYEASLFMQLNEAEGYYFMKLVEMERSSSPNYRNKLKYELKKIKADQENLAKRFDSTAIGNLEQEMTYYSGWQWSAVHILLDIPGYRTPKAIAARLGLSEKLVRQILRTLEDFGMVRREGDQWKIQNLFTHLAKNSPMNPIQHNNWRSRAILSSQVPENENLHYTMVQTVSKDDFEHIKQQLLKAIDDYRKIADVSASEELICLTLDFFKV
ncbi:MAG: TIGR02147 family protein [Bdellovibrionales bacterium]